MARYIETAETGSGLSHPWRMLVAAGAATAALLASGCALEDSQTGRSAGPSSEQAEPGGATPCVESGSAGLGPPIAFPIEPAETRALLGKYGEQARVELWQQLAVQVNTYIARDPYLNSLPTDQLTVGVDVGHTDLPSEQVDAIADSLTEHAAQVLGMTAADGEPYRGEPYIATMHVRGPDGGPVNGDCVRV